MVARRRRIADVLPRVNYEQGAEIDGLFSIRPDGTRRSSIVPIGSFAWLSSPSWWRISL